MNARLITYGRAFRILGAGWLSRTFCPTPNIRVTFTHGVGHALLDNFRTSIQYLREVRTPLSPETFFAILDGRTRQDRNSFLVTFDDGLLSSYQAAREVLDPMGIKAVFFVPTRILNLTTESDTRRFASEQLHRDAGRAATLTHEQCAVMTGDHLKDLDARGHMVCPHTHNHVFLCDIRDHETANTELIRPKSIVEDLLGRNVRAFAFPVGTERQAGAFAYSIIRSHYDFCFTALNGINTPRTVRHCLHRDCLPPDAPLEYVRLVFSGNYDAYYLLKMLRLKQRIAGRTYGDSGPIVQRKEK